MKKLLFAAVVALLSVTGASAQDKVKKVSASVVMDAQGNFRQVSPSAAPGKVTGRTFTTSKGEVLQVLESSKGRLYVVRTSKKSGKEYKQYLN